MKRKGTPSDVVRALRLVATYFDGDHGQWAYNTFDAINAAYFEGRLPTPLIRWSLTPHGGCLGLTRATDRPIVTLHPSLLGGTERVNPWDISPDWLGVAYAFDVLLHETIHVCQYVLHGGGTGPTSHNNDVWIAEINRIAPLLGLTGVEAGLSKTIRVPIKGEFTVRGKPATRVVRRSEGNLPHEAVATFPYGVRRHQGTADAFYRANTTPIRCGQVIPTR
jgi:hypothetical protein